MNIGSIACEQTATRVSVTRAGQGQAFLVSSVRSPVGDAQAVWESYVRIAEALSESGLQVVHERIFGSLSGEAPVMAARKHALQTCGVPSSNPVSYIQGNPPWGEGYAGTIIHAISTTGTDNVWTILDGESPCGRGWRSNGSTCLVLQDINGKHDSLGDDVSRPLQVQQMLDRAERILRENGGSYRDVARTWFYISDILDWYPEFNKSRNGKYGELGIMPRPVDKDLMLPASTGISGETPSGAAATMDLIAIIKGAGSQTEVRQLTNRAQLDAFRYGSAFSRGAVITDPQVSVIEVSGTAAIDQWGKSQFVNDIRGQINCTFDRIETLIAQEGAELSDITAATVFVKRPQYAQIFWSMVRERGLQDFPAVCVVADVCREELLFEIDAEAAVRID